MRFPRWAGMASLLALLAYSYYEPLYRLSLFWLDRDDYSHGFLVPFISLSFAWANRKRLKHLEQRPETAGGTALLLAAVSMLALGRQGDIDLLMQASVVPMAAALVLLFLGYGHLKVLLLPILYLFFMIPVLDPVIERAHWPLQIAAAKASAASLKALGVPALLVQNKIELPAVTLEVARECSGLNYLVSMAALGIPIAYYSMGTALLRVAVVIFGVLVAVLANWARVLLIGLWAYFVDSSDVHGPLHVLQGMFVYIAGLFFLFLGVWAAGRLGLGRKADDNAAAGKSPSSDAPTQFVSLWRQEVIAVLVLAASTGYAYAFETRPVPLSEPLGSIPLTLGEWRGRDSRETLGLHVYPSQISRVYRNGSGAEVWLYVGYLASQDSRMKVADFSIKRFFDGATGGVHQVGERRAAISSFKDGYGKELVALLWFELGGGRTASAWSEAKVEVLKNAVFNGRSNGAFAMIHAEGPAGSKAEAHLKEFAGLISEQIGRAVPDGKR